MSENVVGLKEHPNVIKWNETVRDVIKRGIPIASVNWFTDEAMRAEKVRDVVRMGMSAIKKDLPRVNIFNTQKKYWEHFLSGIAEEAVEESEKAHSFKIEEVERIIKEMDDEKLEEICCRNCVPWDASCYFIFGVWMDKDEDIDEDVEDASDWTNRKPKYREGAPKFIADYFEKEKANYIRSCEEGWDP